MLSHKLKRTMAIAALVAGSLAAVGPAEASQKVTTPLLTVTPDGKFITFEDEGDKIKSKISGKRTKIVINGKEGSREELKAGMTCAIEYEPGDKNEPDVLDCQ